MTSKKSGGKKSRGKGKRGQLIARKILEKRGFIVSELNSGTESGDLLADAPDGNSYLVEVKNQVIINPRKFISQAKKNAKILKRKWALMAKIAGSKTWLVIAEGGKCRNYFLVEEE
jgi:predicted RecB family endonuclease